MLCVHGGIVGCLWFSSVWDAKVSFQMWGPMRCGGLDWFNRFWIKFSCCLSRTWYGFSEFHRRSEFLDCQLLLKKDEQIGREREREREVDWLWGFWNFGLLQRDYTVLYSRRLSSSGRLIDVRFQVLTAASMKFRFVFWDVLPCKIIVDRRFALLLQPERTNVGRQLFNPAVHPRRQIWTSDWLIFVTDCIYIVGSSKFFKDRIAVGYRFIFTL
jgi:hypothetical protein